MASFDLLPQKEEDELHKARLLNVEEKPFKRISKRLLTPNSLLTTPSKLPTPPPDAESDTQDAVAQKVLDDRRQFKEDVLFDFAAFDSSMARIQFLLNSNKNERERYSSAKAHILETAQIVRDSTSQLRLQLGEAKKTLEQRKMFDKLAEKITGNILLRPTREDQRVNLEKLEEECRELERERAQYGITWAERREQFGRIVEEGMSLRRLIRDEKEEVERREGMAEEEDGEVGEGSRGGQTPKHSSISGNATPRPDFVRAGSPDGLKPRPCQSGTLSRPGSRATSRAPSPAVSERKREVDDETENEDSAMLDAVDMVDAGTPAAITESQEAELETPIVTIDEPEEEAENEPEKVVDAMDTT